MAIWRTLFHATNIDTIQQHRLLVGMDKNVCRLLGRTVLMEDKVAQYRIITGPLLILRHFQSECSSLFFSQNF